MCNKPNCPVPKGYKLINTNYNVTFPRTVVAYLKDYYKARHSCTSLPLPDPDTYVWIISHWDYFDLEPGEQLEGLDEDDEDLDDHERLGDAWYVFANAGMFRLIKNGASPTISTSLAYQGRMPTYVKPFHVEHAADQAQAWLRADSRAVEAMKAPKILNRAHAQTLGLSQDVIIGAENFMKIIANSGRPRAVSPPRHEEAELLADFSREGRIFPSDHPSKIAKNLLAAENGRKTVGSYPNLFDATKMTAADKMKVEAVLNNESFEPSNHPDPDSDMDIDELDRPEETPQHRKRKPEDILDKFLEADDDIEVTPPTHSQTPTKSKGYTLNKRRKTADDLPLIEAQTLLAKKPVKKVKPKPKPRKMSDLKSMKGKSGKIPVFNDQALDAPEVSPLNTTKSNEFDKPDDLDIGQPDAESTPKAKSLIVKLKINNKAELALLKSPKKRSSDVLNESEEDEQEGSSSPNTQPAKKQRIVLSSKTTNLKLKPQTKKAASIGKTQKSKPKPKPLLPKPTPQVQEEDDDDEDVSDEDDEEESVDAPKKKKKTTTKPYKGHWQETIAGPLANNKAALRSAVAKNKSSNPKDKVWECVHHPVPMTRAKALKQDINIDDPDHSAKVTELLTLKLRLKADHATTMEYKYDPPSDWDDQKEITSLIKVITQHRRRLAGKKADTRPKYTQVEKDWLKQYFLDNPELQGEDGMMPVTKWRPLAALFNEQFKGRRVAVASQGGEEIEVEDRTWHAIMALCDRTQEIADARGVDAKIKK